MTRGLARRRRGGSNRSSSSASVRLTARASLPGGKRRLACDLATNHAKGAGERDPVGVVVAFSGGLVDQVADGVVDEEETVEFLFGAVGVLGSQHEVGSAEVGFDL